MSTPGGKRYYFQAQRGEYKPINPKWADQFELLECRRGSIILLRPAKSVWGVRQAVVLGFPALGIVLADLDWTLYVDWGISLTLGLFVAVVEVLCFSVAALAGGRIFLRYVARRSRPQGVEVRVVRVAYGHIHHSLTVSSQGATFGLTVLGSRGRIKRALGLAMSAHAA